MPYSSSTTSLQSVIDFVVTQAVPSPLKAPSGYGTALALSLANDVMGDMIAKRFNWKWNSQVGAPFLTNSWQQDYPQIGISNIGWLEDCDCIDVNNPVIPPRVWNLTVRRGLSRSNFAHGRVKEICWLYNSELSFGTWPGANKVYSPLQTAAPIVQNPPMAILDANGNILVLTTFGTTGATAPSLPVNSAEGQTVTDGSVVWTVASPNSQGYRLAPCPAANGPVWQIVPKYQAKQVMFTALQQMINPIPDDHAKYFKRGYKTYCLGASPNPADVQKFEPERQNWFKEMADATRQDDRENDAYAMLPATSVVDTVYPHLRNPQDPGEPY